ncbi:hypothetical protein BH23BAC1_BH23BAC1_50280 [soil metagenome]
MQNYKIAKDKNNEIFWQRLFLRIFFKFFCETGTFSGKNNNVKRCDFILKNSF